jgi:hypothetical protein
MGTSMPSWSRCQSPTLATTSLVTWCSITSKATALLDTSRSVTGRNA